MVRIPDPMLQRSTYHSAPVSQASIRGSESRSSSLVASPPSRKRRAATPFPTAAVMLASLLVVTVVVVMLRNPRAAPVPAVALCAQRTGHRQHPLRRLRPAAGVDHLQGYEPVSRRDGSGAEVLAEPADARRHLCEHRRSALSGTESTGAAASAFQIRSTGGASSTPSAVSGTPASSAADNFRLNQLTNSSGPASTGSAISTAQEAMLPLKAPPRRSMRRACFAFAPS